MRKNIEIGIDVNSKVLAAKLRVISEYAGGLAEELEEIDNSMCPNCGDLLVVTEFYADGCKGFTTRYCHSCGHDESRSNE